MVKDSILPEQLEPEINVDAEIDFVDITPKLVRILKQFEPFGPNNMTPVFYSKNVTDTGYGKTIGKENEHLKLFIKQKNSDRFSAIGFGLGNKIETSKKLFETIYTISENEFNDKIDLQLNLKDIR